MKQLILATGGLAVLTLALVPASSTAGYLPCNASCLKGTDKRVKRTVRSQQREIRRLHRKVERLRGLRDLRVVVRERNEAVDYWRNQIADRDTQIAALASSNVPLAIKSTPLAVFQTSVFIPAREAWPCDSYISGSGFWSYSFDSPSLCP